jgi:hypothetical protein
MQTGRTVDHRKVEAAQIVVREALVVGCGVGLAQIVVLEAEDHCGLAVGEGAERIVPLGGEIAVG